MGPPSEGQRSHTHAPGDLSNIPSVNEDALLEVANAVGRLMRFWGFKEMLGRIWAVLYLSPQPVTAEDLVQRLKTSRGNVSLALTEMSRWGVVHRIPLHGRTGGYVAETDLWRMVSRVIREREKHEVERAGAAFRTALKRIDAAPAAEHLPKAFLKARVTRLLKLTDLADEVLGRSTQSSLAQAAAALPALLKLQRVLGEKSSH